jgi:ubiquinone/menaquinone biosynthesis C-methylase UbiE
MSVENQRLFKIFLDVQRGLPRQGPGSDESTLKALSLCTGLPERPAVLDIGSGPGMQTVALAKALADGHITAVDICQEYLDKLKERAKAAKVAERIDIFVRDMNALPFPPRSFDLIWAEGSAYIMGFEKALVAWKRLLKSGACLAVSELVWLKPNPPAEVAAFFSREYPAMSDAETIVSTIKISGYEPLGHFTLPDAAWWESYYTPLEAKLPSLYERYTGDEDALSIIEITRCEIEMRRRFGSWYGYEFFVGRRVE